MELKYRKNYSPFHSTSSVHKILLLFFCGKEPVYQTLRQLISWAGHGKINKFHSLIWIKKNSCKNKNSVKCLLGDSNEQKD